MIERGDLLALHEPLEALAFTGPIEVDGQNFESPGSLIDWLLTTDHNTPVFIKETINRPVLDVVLANPRFLAEVRHAFLIRRPEEIAVSWYSLERDMRVDEAGVEALCDLYGAVRSADGHAAVVIDSDDLVTQPEATMVAYCDAIGLPYIPESLRWEAGVRDEWASTARWHEAVSASSGFEQHDHPERADLRSVPEVADFVARHQPFYERLYARRVEPNASTF